MAKNRRPNSGLFPALLKHWRGQHGMSQLDLALNADVSARHISFLETGRSQPSRAMILQLATALAVPLRHQNEMLTSAGFEAAFAEPGPLGLPPEYREAIERLKAHQEPYPLVVMDRLYNLVDLNRAAMSMVELLSAGGAPQTNALRALFAPDGWQPYITNFEDVGRTFLWRLQREALANPADTALSELAKELTAMPTVNPTWRHVDLSQTSAPSLVIHLKREDTCLSFFTTVTAFSAPQNITAEELRIESYFPHDAQTARTCEAMAARSE